MTIWNLGSINIDHVYHLPRLPRPGETLAATALTEGLGGKGANQSVAAARAGARVRHLGAMGQGGAWARDRLAEAGVDVSGIAQRPDMATGHAIILLDGDAENAIVLHPGTNRAIDEDALVRSLAEMRPGDTLLLQNETNGQLAAARAARAQGARVIYSAAPFDIAALRPLLDHIDIIAMNEHEAAELAAAHPGDLPVAGLLITRGAAGADYRDLTTGLRHEQAAFAVTPVDTTGAGDTFAGYFAAGLDAGASVPDALRMAAAAAALKVTRAGAGDAIPTRAEVEAFLAR